MQTVTCKYRMWSFDAVWGLGLVLVAPGHAEETIVDRKRVSLEYTLTLEDQTVASTNVGKDPLVYTHGSKEIVPGLEKQLTGLQVGDTKKSKYLRRKAMALSTRTVSRRFPRRISRKKGVQWGENCGAVDLMGR